MPAIAAREMTPVLLIAMLLAAIGVWLALLARRRRLGVNAYCASCDYLLRGLTTDLARCPECGADLTAPGARAIGKLRPDRALLFGSVALIAPLVLIVVAVLVPEMPQAPVTFTPAARGPVYVRPTPTTGNAPSNQTISDDALADALLSNPPPGNFRELLGEAINRAQADQSTQPAAWLKRLIDHALDTQADASQEAFVPWAYLIQSVEVTSQMTDGQRARYVRQGIRVSLVLAKTIQIGGPVSVRYTTSVRLIPMERDRISCRLMELSIGDAATDYVLADWPKPASQFETSSPFFAIIPPEEWAKVQPGPAIARVTILVQSGYRGGGLSRDRLLRVETPVTLVGPANEPTTQGQTGR